MNKKNNDSQLDFYQITDLEQVQALSHPLRMRIIETLTTADPMTTKQIADALGEKPTKLYHHMDKLQKVGLIRLTHTRQNRGATEKYYETIARQFRAGPDLFGEDNAGEQKNALGPMINTMFGNTTAELLRLVRDAKPGDHLDELGLLSYIEMHLEQDQIETVQNKLQDVLDYLQSLDEPGSDTEGLRKYRLTIAHYPLDRFDNEKSANE